MGLDVSHDAWSGAYSAFSRWRDALARAAGYEFATLQGDHRETCLIDWGHIEERNYYGEWDQPPSDPLILLIAHSDCEGELKAEHLGLLADRLTELLPPLLDGQDGGGHLGNVRSATERFIAGCRTALAADEPLGVPVTAPVTPPEPVSELSEAEKDLLDEARDDDYARQQGYDVPGGRLVAPTVYEAVERILATHVERARAEERERLAFDFDVLVNQWHQECDRTGLPYDRGRAEAFSDASRIARGES